MTPRVDSAGDAISGTVTIPWDRFYRDSLTLAALIGGRGSFKGIIAVARGGLVPAAIVGRALDIRLIDSVCVASYDDRVQRDGPPALLKGVSGDGSGWVVIDDLVDSGRTIGFLRGLFPQAHFASVYEKPRSRGVVDTVAISLESDAWLIFPWDV